MGLLSNGTPLPWSEAQAHAAHVRRHGIDQFLNIWRALKDRRRDCLLWGDEVEYLVVETDAASKTARLAVRATEALARLQTQEQDAIARGQPLNMSWKPEYAAYMLEGTPGIPYGATIKSLLEVEPNMRFRRHMAALAMGPGQIVTTLSSPVMLGVGGYDFMAPWAPTTPLLVGSEDANDGRPVASGSLFVPDAVISPHPRFATLTRNIRHRRGSKVAINLPIFIDTQTPRPFREPLPESVEKQFPPGTTLPDVVPDALEDHVYLDAMGFGMGCCCLQITFQACSIEEARILYDQLAVLSPIMLALSGASPIHRGFLTDTDCRWDVIAGSVDDRTARERGKGGIPKSRYDSISSFLGPGAIAEASHDNLRRHPADRRQLGLSPAVERTVLAPGTRLAEAWSPAYNDETLVHDPAVFAQLQENGVDEQLARHVAHLFIRDPLVVYRELLDQDDERSSDHFENIQSTNWQTMRFKPPPPPGHGPSIGWRVEFRSMEVQLTDFENAAFSVFIVALVRTLLSFGPSFYMPISKVDENMRRAQQRDAVRTQKFWFRKEVFDRSRGPVALGYVQRVRQVSGEQRTSQLQQFGAQLATWSDPPIPMYASPDQGCCTGSGSPPAASAPLQSATPAASLESSVESGPEDDSCVEMTMDEIINGSVETGFPGLLPLTEAYLRSTNACPKMLAILDRYWQYLGGRASGRLVTAATFWRGFVDRHPSYRHDSRVPRDVLYDMSVLAADVGAGKSVLPEITGSLLEPRSPGSVSGALPTANGVSSVDPSLPPGLSSGVLRDGGLAGGV